MNAIKSPALSLSLPSHREIVLTREFDAPRRLVFETWTQPEYVALWWPSSMSTMTVCDIDLRPGGAWHYVIHEPHGSVYHYRGVYRDVAPARRLSYSEILDVEPWLREEAINTLTFEEYKGRTALTQRILHVSRKSCDGHLVAGIESEAAESYDRLAALLWTMS